MIILRRVFAILVFVAALPYLLAPVYRFPAERSFAGPAIWNPYARLSGTWQRANLHAHGRAWSGLTNGRQSDADVVRAYQERGYTVAGVSDYQFIAAKHGVATIPIYEHGYNVAKQHQLAIGAQRVEWLDFPLWQGLDQKQYVIDRVSRTADLVAIAHPDTGYSADDLRKLGGYHLIEVVNGPFATEDLWDAALSSGHAVWAIANDDNHDIMEPRRMAVAWNMIASPTAATSDIVDALRAGQAYAVSLIGYNRDAQLTSVEVRDGGLTVSSSGTPATFSFIGQNGNVRKTVDQVTQASYTMTPHDSYIRTVIRTPNITIYLNPVIRYDGARLPMQAASVNAALTWLQRAVTAIVCLVVLPMLWRRP